MKYLTLLFSILITFQVQAQEFNWGIPVKLDKDEFVGKASVKRYLLQENNDGLTRLKVQKTDIINNEDVILEKYDANLELQKTVDIVLGGGTNKDLQKVVINKDKFYLFFAVDNQKMHNTLIVQAYDFDGEPIGEEKTLDVITETKALARGEFSIAASANCNHFAVVTIPIYQKKTNETLKVQTFDAGFNSTFSENITLEYPRKRFPYNTAFIMNDGTMFMHKYQKIKKVGWIQDMFVLDKTKKALVSNKLTLKNNNDFLSLSNTMMENEAGNLIYAGMYKKAEKLQAGQGVFYLEFDKTGKIVREVAHPFEDAPNSGFTGVGLKSVELLPNDELLFVASDYNESSVSQGDDVNNRVYSYSCKTFYFSRIKGDELVWTKTFNREPMETKSDRGRLLDVVWMYNEESDKVAVLYNDLQELYPGTFKHRKYTIPTLTTIGSEGEISIKHLLDSGLGNYSDTYTFCPNEFYQRDGYLVLKCSNNIDFKLGRFKL